MFSYNVKEVATIGNGPCVCVCDPSYFHRKKNGGNGNGVRLCILFNTLKIDVEVLRPRFNDWFTDVVGILSVKAFRVKIEFQ